MKKVFISGVSGDIGQKLLEKYRQEGYFVVGQYNRDTSFLQKPYPNCDFFQADFSDSAQVLALAEKISEKHPDIDCIIHNAGMDYYGIFTDMTADSIQKIIQVNLTSVLLLTSVLGKNLLYRKNGSVVVISSIWGRDGGSLEAAYSASKGGLIAFTKALAREWGLSGVRVNAVCAGFIDTKMNAQFTEEDKNAFCETLALGRIGTVDEVAETVFFLSSDKASYITGQIIGVDGGK